MFEPPLYISHISVHTNKKSPYTSFLLPNSSHWRRGSPNKKAKTHLTTAHAPIREHAPRTDRVEIKARGKKLAPKICQIRSFVGAISVARGPRPNVSGDGFGSNAVDVVGVLDESTSPVQGKC
ncbi:hypothetical protein EVAR_15132_1 [Eumeta japonica]|uniref:Uncharacterized protein n=1 Tax=Eumeta variegata TaxID=151549 RepID=A0A4C1UI76_EUMVA|nr:hypothetical protein EVAR_15132_1 [Eumeta japonica]